MFYGTKFHLGVARVFVRAGYVDTKQQEKIWPDAAYLVYEKQGKRLKKSPKEASLIAIATHFHLYSNLSDYDKQGIFAAAWAIAEADPKTYEIEDILLRLCSGIALDDTSSEIFFKIK